MHWLSSLRNFTIFCPKIKLDVFFFARKVIDESWEVVCYLSYFFHWAHRALPAVQLFWAGRTMGWMADWTRTHQLQQSDLSVHYSDKLKAIACCPRKDCSCLSMLHDPDMCSALVSYLVLFEQKSKWAKFNCIAMGYLSVQDHRSQRPVDGWLSCAIWWFLLWWKGVVDQQNSHPLLVRPGFAISDGTW